MNCGIVDSFQQFEVHTPFHFETVYPVTKPMPTYVSTPAFWTTLRISHFKITSQWYQVLLSSNHFNNTIDPISDFQAAVVVTTKEYMEAWGRKDSHGVANCYAEDGIFLVPGRDVLRGRKGVHQAFHKHTCLSVCLSVWTRCSEHTHTHTHTYTTWNHVPTPMVELGLISLIHQNLYTTWKKLVSSH